MKTRQGGFTLSSFISLCVLVGIAAWLITTVAPPLLKNQDLRRVIKMTLKNSSSAATVEEMRSAYYRSAGLNNLNLNLSQNELKITQSGSSYVFTYNYEVRVPLVANASLVLEFKDTLR
jgi:hypothetical protein